MYEALHTPWKIENEVRRWLLLPRIWLLFYLAGIKVGKGWRIYGTPMLQVHRLALVQIGNYLQLRSHRSSNPLVPVHPVLLSVYTSKANLVIGDHFAMTGGVIVATQSITIGHHVTVGANCSIIDSDFHPIHATQRRVASSGGTSAPIDIEDDVFIGTECLILKGVSIGRGSVIGARSVVTRSVPPGCIAAGSPAKVLRLIEEH